MQKEKDYIDDLSLEIELLDEDTKIDYKIGDTFIKLTVSEAIERIESEKESLDATTDKMKQQISDLKSEMDELKAQLYSKFGNSINLDKD
ncbi:Prefoldin subunit 4 [Smittium culicis]|uniref:Prefoldin subunit 4 n=1 Tax=Smittium culicis TaxID=133412 RepID=A0A1R1XIE2_9FUNG|nr:Prefoldin subunit 4 [Smittium culicis]